MDQSQTAETIITRRIMEKTCGHVRNLRVKLSAGYMHVEGHVPSPLIKRMAHEAATDAMRALADLIAGTRLHFTTIETDFVVGPWPKAPVRRKRVDSGWDGGRITS